MDQPVKPAPRIAPLPVEHSPDLKESFEAMRRIWAVPNSILIMQRVPRLARALAQLTAIWHPEGKVDRGLKRLIAHVASRTAGCQYCMAHTAGGALHFGIDDRKLAAVWDYQVSPLYSAAERAALDLAVAAGAVPNAATDQMFLELRKHWTEEQIVEIVGVIAVFGFNRWNDVGDAARGRADRGRGNILPRTAGRPASTRDDPRVDHLSTAGPCQPPFCGCPGLLVPRVPNPRRAIVGRSHDPPAVGAERGGYDRPVVALQHGDEVACLRVPQPGRPVRGRRDDLPSIGAE